MAREQKSNVNELIRLAGLNNNGYGSLQTWTTNYNATSNQTSYSAIGAALGVNTTESARQLTIYRNYRLKRLYGLVSVNGKDHATPIAVRDDGVSIGTISLGIGTTGDIDSGALDIAIASGSKVNFIVDTSTSTDGNSLTIPVLIAEVLIV